MKIVDILVVILFLWYKMQSFSWPPPEILSETDTDMDTNVEIQH